ncbi:MAG: zinc-ribbon domain-containing protein [Desulfomonilaceae bacterium]|nr:zinc-ribbon domain-containing protein [Desulfomonilaceae bacterium]
MVIRCSHCKSMMRLDEAGIPAGGGVKVRCPKCRELDYVEDPSLSKNRAKTSPTASKVGLQTSKNREPSSRPAPGTDASRESEPSIPEDAFQGFRFPAEREQNSFSASPRSTWARVVIWVGVSLAVVAFFALLVNVILSGPAGTRPFVGGGNQSGSVDRPNPEH